MIFGGDLKMHASSFFSAGTLGQVACYTRSPKIRRPEYP